MLLHRKCGITVKATRLPLAQDILTALLSTTKRALIKQYPHRHPLRIIRHDAAEMAVGKFYFGIRKIIPFPKACILFPGKYHLPYSSSYHSIVSRISLSNSASGCHPNPVRIFEQSRAYRRSWPFRSSTNRIRPQNSRRYPAPFPQRCPAPPLRRKYLRRQT